MNSEKKPRTVRKTKKSSQIDILTPFANEGRESASKILQLLVSALTLVAGLAWNDAIKGFITNFVDPFLKTVLSEALGTLASVLLPFVYAILITLGVVFIINRIKKIEDRIKPEDKD